MTVEFKDFHVFERFSVNNHSNESDLFMETAVACCARVDMEQVKFLVIDDFQDV